MLNARPVGHAVEQARHVGHVADRLQILVPVELLDQRDHVNRPRRFRQIDHPGINPPVRIEREIFDPQMLGRLVVSKVVEQNRAQNRALGLYVRRKSAETVISSRQSIYVFPELSKRQRHPIAPWVVDARRILWKTNPNRKKVGARTYAAWESRRRSVRARFMRSPTAGRVCSHKTVRHL